MKLTAKFIFLCSFIFIGTHVFSNNGYIKKKGKLPILELLNPKLPCILDSIINYEKTCKYYNKSLIFYLTVKKMADTSLEFYFESNDSFEYAFMKPDANNIGCFTFKNHVFVVENYTLCPLIFKKTTQLKKIKYKVLVLEYPIEDDSFTKWIYNFKNEAFNFVKRYSYCDDNWRIERRNNWNK